MALNRTKNRFGISAYTPAMTTWFRPPFFASYKAASAAARNASTFPNRLAASPGHVVAAPTLTITTP
jgi:hypothetical protein